MTVKLVRQPTGNWNYAKDKEGERRVWMIFDGNNPIGKGYRRRREALRFARRRGLTV